MRDRKYRVWDGKQYYYLKSNNKEANHYLQIGETGFFLYESTEGKLIACSLEKGVLEEYTGFKDSKRTKKYPKGKEIYEGDILSDWTETDEGMVQSKMQVFWGEKTGAWKLDNSFSQNKSSSDLLSDELEGFTYEVTGNIHQKINSQING